MTGEASVDNAGKIGKCYSFTGNQYLKMTNITISTTSWSLAAWIYPTADSSSGHQYIVGLNTSSSSDFLGSLCYYANKFGVRTGGTTYSASSTSELNQWYHVVATYNGSILKLYVNRELVKSQSSPSSPAAASTVYIGVRGNVSGYFQGKLNDIRVYDHCLSQKEIDEISRGLVLHYKMDDTYIESTTNLMSYNSSRPVINTINMATNTSSYGYYIQSISELNNTKYTFSGYIDNTSNSNIRLVVRRKKVGESDWSTASGATIFSPILQSGQSGWLATNVIDLTDSTQWQPTVQVGIYSNNQPRSSMTSNPKAGFLQLEEKDHQTFYTPGGTTRTPAVYDSSGYGNNGTVGGSLAAAAGSPRYSLATTFNESGYILATQIAPTNTLIHDFSCAFWINKDFDTASSSNKYILRGPLQIYIYQGTKNLYASWQLATADLSYDSNNSWNPGLSINQNTWTHIVITFSDGKLKCYKNGEQFATSTRTNGQYIKYLGYRIIGKYQSTSSADQSFKGQLSDIRYYMTELNADQVKELYNTSMTIDASGKSYARELVEK